MYRPGELSGSRMQLAALENVNSVHILLYEIAINHLRTFLDLSRPSFPHASSWRSHEPRLLSMTPSLAQSVKEEIERQYGVPVVAQHVVGSDATTGLRHSGVACV